MSIPSWCSHLAMLALLSGCSTWKHTPLAAGDPLAISSERPIRVTRTDRSILVLQDARIEGDSVIGSIGNPPMRHAVALSAIQSIDQRQVSAGRTAGAAVGGAALLLVVVGVGLILYWASMLNGG